MGKSLEERMDNLERRVETLVQLPSGSRHLKRKSCNFATRCGMSLLAKRAETRAGDEETRRMLREEIRAGDEETKRRADEHVWTTCSAPTNDTCACFTQASSAND